MDNKHKHWQVDCREGELSVTFGSIRSHGWAGEDKIILVNDLEGIKAEEYFDNMAEVIRDALNNANINPDTI